MANSQYLLYKGRTLPVVATVRSSGIECLVVMEGPGIPKLVPAFAAVQAPSRSKPRLVVDNT